MSPHPANSLSSVTDECQSALLPMQEQAGLYFERTRAAVAAAAIHKAALGIASCITDACRQDI